MNEEFVAVFDDEIGQRIKTSMRNYAHEHYGPDIKDLEEMLNRTCVIVGLTRRTMLEALKAEVDVLCFRNSTRPEQVPTMFIAGILHATDVIQGQGSIVGKD